MSGSSDTIKEFLVGLGFDIDEAGLKKFAGGVAVATAKVVALSAAVTAAAGYMVALVTDSAKDLDKVSDLAARVNSTANEILELGHVASLTDSSLDAVMSSFDGLAQSAGEAFMGIGRGKIVFQALGLSVKDQHGKLKNTAVLMQEIGDKLKGMEAGQQQAVLTKLGIDRTMVQALTTDVTGLRDEYRAMYQAAGIDANAAAKASSDYMDSLTRLGFVIDGVRKAVALRFMGQIQQSMDGLRKQLVSNMPQVISAIEPIVAVALRIAEAFTSVGGRVIQIIAGLLGWFDRVNKATDGWALIVGAAVAAWRLLNLSFLATPLGMVLSLVAAIGLLVDDFLTWKEGGQSLIDWTEWEPGMTAAIDGITKLGDVAFNVFDAIFQTVKMLIQFLIGDFAGGWATAAKGGQALIDTLTSLWNVVSNLVTAFVKLTGLDKHLPSMSDIVKHLPSMPDLSGVVTGLFPSLAPSPQAAQAISGAQQTVSQKTEIVVQGAGSPDATARAVVSAQSRVNADLARNLRGGVR